MLLHYITGSPATYEAVLWYCIPVIPLSSNSINFKEKNLFLIENLTLIRIPWRAKSHIAGNTWKNNIWFPNKSMVSLSNLMSFSCCLSDGQIIGCSLVCLSPPTVPQMPWTILQRLLSVGQTLINHSCWQHKGTPASGEGVQPWLMRVRIKMNPRCGRTLLTGMWETMARATQRESRRGRASSDRKNWMRHY